MDYRPIQLTTADGFAAIENAALFAAAQDSPGAEGEKPETIYRTTDGRQFSVRESCAEIDALLRAASLKINTTMAGDMTEICRLAKIVLAFAEGAHAAGYSTPLPLSIPEVNDAFKALPELIGRWYHPRRAASELYPKA